MKDDLAQRMADEAELDMTACPYKSPFWRWMWVKGELEERQRIAKPMSGDVICPACHASFRMSLMMEAAG